MKAFYLLILLALSSCNKVSEDNNPVIIVSEDELVGAWEEQGESRGFLLGLYCDSFELREDKSFAIYYWTNGSPSNDRIDGSWRIEEENSLVFFVNDSYEIKEKVILLENGLLKIESEDRGIKELRKN